jgi:capsid portal protein
MEVLGVRRAEEVNYVTLSNNNIPSLVISVSNGRLTGGTIARIKQFVDTVIRGSSNYSQVLILEGESGLDTADSAEGQVKIDIKPLTASQHTDALFVNYCKNGKDSMRRAFRLPELFVGMSQGLNRATAVEARKLADEQVFAPERAYEDHEINGLLQAQGFFYHKFVSRTPNVTDNETMVVMRAAAERTGGVTPRIARTIVEEAFPSAANAPPLDPRKFDPDVPFSITLAEKVKNQSDPTELNQQGPPVESAIPTDEEKSMTASSGNANSMLREILSFGDQLAASVRREIGKASNEG